ncbi:MAG TPA: protein phosphatase 2C domain-containing protein [Ktedonobacteraceae bacterium]
MFAQITSLRYWKSEHDAQTCEDAYGEDARHGLFAVADGVGTTLFSNIWSSILVERFLAVPLMSDNAFEIEWWVRQAQKQFQQNAPQADYLSWNALQKAQSEGSQSTLVTLRLTHVEANSAYADLLVFGDSCVLLGKLKAKGQFYTFPLDKADDFDRAPVCIPSKLSIFNRYFNRCQMKRVWLEAGDVVVLATDAVSRWIISAGNGRYSDQFSALQAVIAQTPATWANFIEECRARREMIDDDCTALVIALQPDGLNNGVPLEATNEHPKAVREQRKREFESAVAEKNREMMAIIFGDGNDLALEGVVFPEEQLEQARGVADAMRELMFVLRRELNTPGVAATVKPVWQRYVHILGNEPCAASLRQTLARIGVLETQPPLSAAPDEYYATISSKESLATEPTIILTREQLQRGEQIQQALSSHNAEQMARTYEAGTIDPTLLSRQEMNLLQLAYSFRQAYQQGTDDELVATFEAIQRDQGQRYIIFTLEEEERISQVWRRKMGQLPQDQIDAMVPTIKAEGVTQPAQKRSWLSKLTGRGET